MTSPRSTHASKMAGWKPLGIFLVLCLGVWVYLFFLRLPGRDAYFTQRELREVATISDQIRAALEGRLDGITQAAKYREVTNDTQTDRQSAIDKIPSLTLIDEQQCRPGPDVRLARESVLYVEHAHRFRQETSPPYWDRAYKEITAETKGGAEVYFRFACDALPRTSPTPEPTPTFVTRVDLTLHYARDPIPPAVPAPRERRSKGYGATATPNTTPTASPTTTSTSCGQVKDRFLCAKASLGELLEPAFKDSPIEGYDLFVADGKGAVIFERGPRALRLERLLPESREPSKEGAAPERSWFSSPTREGLPPLEAVQRTSQAEKVRLGGAVYRFFSQPLPMPVLWTGGEEVRDDQIWVVGLLIPEGEYQGDVQHVSYGSVSSAPLLLLFLLLVTPILKIFLVGSRARLRKRDLRLSVLGLVLAGGVGAVFFDSNVAYLRLEGYLDADLQAWSEKLRDSFSKELLGTSKALDAFDDHETLPTSMSSDDQSPCAGRTDIRTRIFHQSNPEISCPFFAEIRQQQPNLEMLFRSDVRGNEPQQVKWTPYESTTPLLKSRTTSRPFNERWRSRTSLWAADASCRLTPPFLLFSIRSPTTGKVVAAFERAGSISPQVAAHRDQASSGDSQTNPPQADFVAVPELISLTSVVVPASFGFAIIEAGGKVVFHSTQARNLVENFLTEVDDPDRVAAAMAARAERWVDTHYHGRLQRMYVHPVTGMPWTLVAFRDKELLRSIDFDVTLTWILSFLLYGVAAVLVLEGYFFVLGSHDTGWMWPDPSRNRLYWACAAVLGVHLLFSGLCLLGFGSKDGWNLTIGAVGLPFSGFSFCVAMLVSSSRPPVGDAGRKSCRWVVVALAVLGGTVCCALMATALGRPTWALGLAVTMVVLATYASTTPVDPRTIRQTRDSFVTLGLLSLILCGVIPALALYKDAFDLGVEVLLRHGQMHLANRLAEREQRIRNDERDWQGSGLLGGRLSETKDLPPRGFFWGGERHLAAPPPRTSTQNVSWFDPEASCPGRLLRYLFLNHNTRGTFLDTSARGTTPDASLTPTPTVGRTVEGGGFEGTSVVSCAPLAGGPSRAASSSSAELLKNRCRDRRCDTFLQGEPAKPLWLLLQRHPTGALMYALPPWRQRECVETRTLVFEEAADASWQSWRETSEEGEHQCLGVFDPRFDLAGEGRNRARQQIQMCSALPMIALGRDLPVLYWLFGTFVAGLSLWIVASTILGVAQRTVAFRDDRPKVPETKPTPWYATGLLLIDPPTGVVSEVRHWLEKHRIDLHGGVPVWAEKADGLILVDNLGHRLDDAQWNRDKLKLLERLVLAEQKRVVVISRVDPLVYFRDRLQSAGDRADSSYITQDELDRWARVLERLARFSPGFYLREDRLTVEGLKRLLEYVEPPRASVVGGWPEVRGTGRLAGIAEELAVYFGTESVEDRAMVARHAARAHYRSLWASLTDRERLILRHVADEGFENFDEQSWRVARPLLRRGYLRFQPEVVLMNDSFRAFVSGETETEEEILALERADGASWWEQVRNVLVPAVIVVGLLLSQIHPELLTILVGTLTALTTAGGAVAQLLGFLGPSGRKGDASS